MEQIRENWPVIETLQGLGYQAIHPVNEERNIYSLTDPQGQRRTYLFAKSGTKHDRHRYGLSLRSLKEAEGVVFWGRWESRLFIIPTEWLQGVHEAQWDAQVNRGDQWVVNVRFNQRELKAARDDDTQMLSTYEVAIPDELRRRVSNSERLPKL